MKKSASHDVVVFFLKTFTLLLTFSLEDAAKVR